MSLLIKALASAEKGKQAESEKRPAAAGASVGLMLEPLSKTEPAVSEQKQDSNTVAEASSNKEEAFNAAAAASLEKVRQQSDTLKEHSQQAAANVFVANQLAAKPVSLPFLIMCGATGALLIWLGLQGYQHFNQSAAMQTAVSKPASPPVAALNNVQSPADVPGQQTDMVAAQSVESSPASAHETAPAPKPEQVAANHTPADTSLFADTASSGVLAPKPAQSSAVKKTADRRVADDGEVSNTSPGEPKGGAPLKLIARTPAAGVDPILLSAYEAYSRSDDAAAQKQYRQVLQADKRNVDALLGMAAIAAKQSRHADANGWYQKVLEIEPRNSVALSAMANMEISGESAGAGAADYAASESRIKNMLAQQPESANLHAALGNLYAARNQWGLAQAAYFDASRYAPNSADYAFNLAVSLDQLGKSALALAQYQRALDLLNNSGTGRVDKAQLEARIKALQE